MRAISNFGLLFAFAVGLGGQVPCLAGDPTAYWLEPVDGDWEDPERWVDEFVPTTASHVVFGVAGQPYTSTINGTTFIRQLALQSPDVTLHLRNNRNLSIDSLSTVPGAVLEMGYNTHLFFKQSTVLGGGGEIRFVNPGGNPAGITRFGQFIINPDFTIRAHGGAGRLNWAHNNGLVIADAPDSLIMVENIQPGTGQYRAVNGGEIRFMHITAADLPDYAATDGGITRVWGFDNTGNVLTIDGPEKSLSLGSPAFHGGTVVGISGGMLHVPQQQFAQLLNVDLGIDVTAGLGSRLNYNSRLIDGATLRINSSGPPSGMLELAPGVTLRGEGEVVFFGGGQLTMIDPRRDPATNTSTLVIESGITVRTENAGFRIFATTGDQDRVLINHGTLAADSPGFTVTTVLPSHVFSDGTIRVRSGAMLHFNSTLEFDEANSYVAVLGPEGLGWPPLLLTNGAAEIAGTLEIQLAPDYTPALGDQFALLVAPTVTGAFSDHQFPDIGPLEWNLIQTQQQVHIQVIPEPHSAMLLGLGLAAAMRRRRRVAVAPRDNPMLVRQVGN